MRRILVVALVLIYASVADGASRKLAYRIETGHDDFQGWTFARMHNNRVTPEIEMNLFNVRPDSGGDILSLMLVYSSGDWAMIDAGQTLTLLVDSLRTRLSGDGSGQDRTVNEGPRVCEIAMYDITRDMLTAVSGASRVRCQLAGSRRVLEFELGSESRARFGHFLSVVKAGDAVIAPN